MLVDDENCLCSEKLAEFPHFWVRNPDHLHNQLDDLICWGPSILLFAGKGVTSTRHERCLRFFPDLFSTSIHFSTNNKNAFHEKSFSHILVQVNVPLPVETQSPTLTRPFPSTANSPDSCWSLCLNFYARLQGWLMAVVARWTVLIEPNRAFQISESSWTQAEPSAKLAAIPKAKTMREKQNP